MIFTVAVVAVVVVVPRQEGLTSAAGLGAAAEAHDLPPVPRPPLLRPVHALPAVLLSSSLLPLLLLLFFLFLPTSVREDGISVSVYGSRIVHRAWTEYANWLVIHYASDIALNEY